MMVPWVLARPTSGGERHDREDFGGPCPHHHRWSPRGGSGLSDGARPHLSVLDTPTEFPQPRPHQRSCPVQHPQHALQPFWLINEQRPCPYDEIHGILSLRPGYDAAYLTQVEFDHAQKAAVSEFHRVARRPRYKRNWFPSPIRAGSPPTLRQHQRRAPSTGACAVRST